jgi:hypothetical protein
VLLGERETLPVVVRRTCGGEESALARFRDCAVLAVVDVDRNELFAGYAKDRDKIRARPIDRSEIDLEATLTERHVLEARERVGVPWRPGKYVATVLLREKVSNRAPIEMARTQYDDPDVVRFLSSQSVVGAPAGVWPPGHDPLPSYRATPESPPVPKEHGVTLVAPRVVVLRPEAACVLRGSFRLRVGAEDLVPGDADAARDYGGAKAIVPIHLLVMAAEVGAPLAYTLRVPSFDVTREGDGGVATGHFAVDLYGLGRPGPRPETFFLYTFSRETMSGPVKTSTVTVDMLPPGAPDLQPRR